MNIDTEADYWKDIFVHILHKNMVRQNAERLTFEMCPQVFKDFCARHPEYSVQTDFSDIWCSFEVLVTDNVKLRLYIQSTVKGTLLQYEGSEYIKIADAKFPYNPFPEVEEFLLNIPQYKAELEKLKIKSLCSNRQLKLARQFLQAILAKKLNSQVKYIWNIEEKTSFLQVTVKSEEKTWSTQIHPENLSEIYKWLENLAIS